MQQMCEGVKMDRRQPEIGRDRYRQDRVRNNAGQVSFWQISRRNVDAQLSLQVASATRIAAVAARTLRYGHPGLTGKGKQGDE